MAKNEELRETIEKQNIHSKLWVEIYVEESSLVKSQQQYLKSQNIMNGIFGEYDKLKKKIDTNYSYLTDLIETIESLGDVDHSIVDIDLIELIPPVDYHFDLSDMRNYWELIHKAILYSENIIKNDVKIMNKEIKSIVQWSDGRIQTPQVASYSNKCLEHQAIKSDLNNLNIKKSDLIRMDEIKNEIESA